MAFNDTYYQLYGEDKKRRPQQSLYSVQSVPQNQQEILGATPQKPKYRDWRTYADFMARHTTPVAALDYLKRSVTGKWDNIKKTADIIANILPGVGNLDYAKKMYERGEIDGNTYNKIVGDLTDKYAGDDGNISKAKIIAPIADTLATPFEVGSILPGKSIGFFGKDVVKEIGKEGFFNLLKPTWTAGFSAVKEGVQEKGLWKGALKPNWGKKILTDAAGNPVIENGLPQIVDKGVGQFLTENLANFGGKSAIGKAMEAGRIPFKLLFRAFEATGGVAGWKSPIIQQAIRPLLGGAIQAGWVSAGTQALNTPEEKARQSEIKAIPEGTARTVIDFVTSGWGDVPPILKENVAKLAQSYNKVQLRRSWNDMYQAIDDKFVNQIADPNIRNIKIAQLNAPIEESTLVRMEKATGLDFADFRDKPLKEVLARHFSGLVESSGTMKVPEMSKTDWLTYFNGFDSNSPIDDLTTLNKDLRKQLVQQGMTTVADVWRNQGRISQMDFGTAKGSDVLEAVRVALNPEQFAVKDQLISNLDKAGTLDLTEMGNKVITWRAKNRVGGSLQYLTKDPAAALDSLINSVLTQSPQRAMTANEVAKTSALVTGKEMPAPVGQTAEDLLTGAVSRTGDVPPKSLEALRFRPNAESQLKPEAVDTIIKDLKVQVTKLADVGKQQEVIQALDGLSGDTYRSMGEFVEQIDKSLPRGTPLSFRGLMTQQATQTLGMLADPDMASAMASQLFTNMPELSATKVKIGDNMLDLYPRQTQQRFLGSTEKYRGTTFDRLEEFLGRKLSDSEQNIFGKYLVSKSNSIVVGTRASQQAEDSVRGMFKDNDQALAVWKQIHTKMNEPVMRVVGSDIGRRSTLLDLISNNPTNPYSELDDIIIRANDSLRDRGFATIFEPGQEDMVPQLSKQLWKNIFGAYADTAKAYNMPALPKSVSGNPSYRIIQRWYNQGRFSLRPTFWAMQVPEVDVWGNMQAAGFPEPIQREWATKVYSMPQSGDIPLGAREAVKELLPGSVERPQQFMYQMWGRLSGQSANWIKHLPEELQYAPEIQSQMKALGVTSPLEVPEVAARIRTLMEAPDPRLALYEELGRYPALKQSLAGGVETSTAAEQGLKTDFDVTWSLAIRKSWDLAKRDAVELQLYNVARTSAERLAHEHIFFPLSYLKKVFSYTGKWVIGGSAARPYMASQVLRSYADVHDIISKRAKDDPIFKIPLLVMDTFDPFGTEFPLSPGGLTPFWKAMSRAYGIFSNEDDSPASKADKFASVLIPAWKEWTAKFPELLYAVFNQQPPMKRGIYIQKDAPIKERFSPTTDKFTPNVNWGGF